MIVQVPLNIAMIGKISETRVIADYVIDIV